MEEGHIAHHVILHHQATKAANETSSVSQQAICCFCAIPDVQEAFSCPQAPLRAKAACHPISLVSHAANPGVYVLLIRDVVDVLLTLPKPGELLF